MIRHASLFSQLIALFSRIEFHRIVVKHKEKQRGIVLLTNHLDFGATTISAIYKERWQIDLFFKDLKQNLKIKTFVGTSENALCTQIWTALIAMLLIKYLQFKSKLGWSLSNLVAFLDGTCSPAVTYGSGLITLWKSCPSGQSLSNIYFHFQVLDSIYKSKDPKS